MLRKNGWFYWPYLLFISLAGATLLLFSKTEIHLFLNAFHCKSADLAFIFLTHLGDGITVALFILSLLFIKYRYAIIMFLSTISVTLTVQAFKRYILPDINRPKIVFEHLAELYYVPGIQVHTSHSFPSGHTASGFSIFLLMALITKNKYLKLVYFFVALLIAYSRVYLSQHFLIDIYFGSIIAVLLTGFNYVWVNKWKNKKLDLSLSTSLRIKKNDRNK
ncbi:MAG: phosphatase PAP2 family protein [Bacteroidales bacterium]|nr:phosphatase PAP2 family protein [Bacteroidales bacterium]